MNRFLFYWRIAFVAAIGLLPTATMAQLADQSVTSKGSSFWCAFLENLDLAWNDAPEFTFQIYAENDVTGTISLVRTGLNIPFTVNGGTISSIEMPKAVYYPKGSEAVSDFGILISASDSIEVRALHWREYFSESSAILPAQELGSHYLTQCYRYNGDDQSAFIVVATEDNTVVSITPSVVTLNGQPAGIPINVTLDRGQTYQVQSFGNLSGTDIQSPADKPVAVFGGAKTSQVECTSANSHLYDQGLPLDRDWFWGNRFFAVPFFGQNSSVIQVLASEDSTRVYQNCAVVAVLKKGESWRNIFGVATMIYADKPVAVSQLARGVLCSGASQSGDPVMTNLLPEGISGRKAVIKVPKRNSNGFSFSKNTLTLIAKAGESDNIRLNGVFIDNFLHVPIASSPWEYTRIQVMPDSTYHLDADATDFQAFSHGFDYANGYANWVSFDRVVLDTMIMGVSFLAPDTVCVDSVFTVSVEGAESQWVELHFGGERQRIQENQALQLGQPGVAIFSAAVLPSGTCLPQLISAQTVAINCPAPPDTCDLKMPNAFSPNGDGSNDLFRPVKAECSFTEYEFSIYNRWGRQVFSSRQPFEGWDGKISNGEDAPMDVYVWQLTYRRYDAADQIQLKGEVSLLR